MKSKELKIYNIPRENPPLLMLTIKPRKFLVILLIGSAFLFWFNNVLSIVGVVISAISMFALVAMPDRTLLEIYETMLIIYDSRQMDNCHCIYWEDILNWQYIRSQHGDRMRIELIDGQSIECDCYKNRKLMMFMNLFAHGKEKKVIRKRGKIQ